MSLYYFININNTPFKRTTNNYKNVLSIIIHYITEKVFSCDIHNYDRGLPLLRPS